MRFLLFFFISISLKSYSQYTFKNSIVYVKSFNTEKTTTSFSLLNRPDSIYYTVLYNNRASLSFTNPKNSYITQEEISRASEFTLTDIDSFFIIQKRAFCDKPLLLSFPHYSVLKSKEDTNLLNMRCNRAYTVNKLGDTTIFYLSKDLPNTAGLFVINNLNECLLGFVSKTMSVFPRATTQKHSQPLIFNIDLNGTDKNVLSQETWIDGKASILEESKKFPQFIARDTKKRWITNDSLKQDQYFIFVVLNNLIDCENYNEKYLNLYTRQKEQNKELLIAASKLAKEKTAQCYVITTDYTEKIKESIYPDLRIIPNAAAWKEKTQIVETPLILIVRNNVLMHKLTPFDFGEDEFYNGIKKLLINKQKTASF